MHRFRGIFGPVLLIFSFVTLVSCQSAESAQSAKPIVVAATSTLTTANVTRFKIDLKDYSAGGFNSSQACTVAAGTNIKIKSDFKNATDGMHVRVTLAERLANCDFMQGYLFKKHLTSSSLEALTNSAVDGQGADENSSTTTPVSNLNQKLNAFYSDRDNFQKVYDYVLSKRTEGTERGCVAFLSTALQMIGFKLSSEDLSDKPEVLLVTLPFYKYLLAKNFKKIEREEDLLPGDIVLTKENGDPGYPAHTYMFHGWSKSEKSKGLVIDNQQINVDSSGTVRSFIHTRNIFSVGGSTPAAFALRSVN